MYKILKFGAFKNELLMLGKTVFIKKYLNERTKAHFEMNKTVLISQGIKEPQLYQYTQDSFSV